MGMEIEHIKSLNDEPSEGPKYDMMLQKTTYQTIRPSTIFDLDPLCEFSDKNTLKKMFIQNPKFSISHLYNCVTTLMS